MKKILLLLCVGSLLVTSSKTSGQEAKKQVSKEINAVQFKYSASTALDYLSSDELNGRDTGSEEIDEAASYIEKAFVSFGVQPYFETYRDSFRLKEVDGFNVVGVLKSSKTNTNLKPLLIGAHYDHIGIIKSVKGDSIANGANDNASGTVAVLELAKFLVDQDLGRDVIFALFSAEEKGLVGSRHLAEKMKAQDVVPYVVFNIEMLGVQMKDKNYRAYVTGYKTSNLAEVFNSYYDIKDQFLGFLPQASQYGLFKRSDNYPFFEVFNVPAQTICTFDFTNYEYYHHVNDEYEELDIDAYLKLLEDLKPGVLQLINSKENAVKLK